jgi:hypothetical protein
MKKLPKSRRGRIEHIARIAVGRDPDDPGRPAPGWQAKLSALMGVSHGTVNATLKLRSSPVFDRSLIQFAIELQERLERDREELELYFHTLAAEQEAAAMGDKK